MSLVRHDSNSNSDLQSPTTTPCCVLPTLYFASNKRRIQMKRRNERSEKNTFNPKAYRAGIGAGVGGRLRQSEAHQLAQVRSVSPRCISPH